MTIDTILLLIKIIKVDNTTWTFKLTKPEAYTYKELFNEIKEQIAFKFENYFIKKSVFFDDDFKSEIDIPENEIFLLENKQIFTFYIEESTLVSESVAVTNLNQSMHDCSIVSEVDFAVVSKVKSLIDVAQPVCHSPEFSLWRKKVMSKTGNYLVNSR